MVLVRGLVRRKTVGKFELLLLFNAASQPQQTLKREATSASNTQPHKRTCHQSVHEGIPAEAAATVISATCSLAAGAPMTRYAQKQPKTAVDVGQGDQPTDDKCHVKVEPAQAQTPFLSVMKGLGGNAGQIDDETRQALCEVGYGSPQGQLLRPPSRGGGTASSLGRQQSRLWAPSWGHASVDGAFTSTPSSRMLTPATPESIPPLVDPPVLNTPLVASRAGCHALLQLLPSRSAGLKARLLEKKPLLSMELDGAAAQAAVDTHLQHSAWCCHLQHDTNQRPSDVLEPPAVADPAPHPGPFVEASDRTVCQPDTSFTCSEEASWQQAAADRVLRPSCAAASSEPGHVLRLQATSRLQCFTGP